MEPELSQLLAALLNILIVTLFLNWAAGIVLDRSSFGASLIVAIAGTLLAGLVLLAVGGVLGIVLAVVVWAVVSAVMYRTNLARGAVVGVVAWLLWALVQWLMDILVRAIQNA